MDKYDGLTDAVIDVTRPAFEGIEDWDRARVADTGAAVARCYLEDFGYDLMGSTLEDGEGTEVLLARNGDGEACAVSVTARRMLGYVPEDIEPLHPRPSEELLSRVSALSDGCGVRPCAIVIDFLSNRIAHISMITYPMPD